MGFAFGAQTLVKARQDRIVTSGREGSHIEAAAQSASPTKDSALAPSQAAVVIKWREPSEGGRLATIELTKLGHLREQERGGARAHSANGRKFLRFVAKDLVLGDQTGEALFDRGHLLFDLVDQPAT